VQAKDYLARDAASEELFVAAPCVGECCLSVTTASAIATLPTVIFQEQSLLLLSLLLLLLLSIGGGGSFAHLGPTQLQAGRRVSHGLEALKMF